LAVPEAQREALADLQARLGQRLRGPRWAGPGSHHVTLAFLGDVNEAGRDCAFRAADSLARLKPLAVRFSGLAGFPPHGPFRVLTLGLDDAADKFAGVPSSEAGVDADVPAGEGSSPLLDCWTRLNEALRAAELRHGIEPLNAEYPSGRPFRPHVTLARVGAATVDRREWQSYAPLAAPLVEAPFEISECIVYESKLAKEGASYVVLRSVALRGAEV
jgi:2'-5' RNA ligase